MMLLTQTEIFIFFIVILEIFVSSSLYFIKQLPNMSFLEYYTRKFSDVLNVSLILIAYYLLIVKKTKKTIYIILCLTFIVKALMHFFVTDELYKLFNFDKKTQEKILYIKQVETFITNFLLGLLSIYIVYYTIG